LLSLPSPRNHGSFSSRVPFLGKGNGVNRELGTGKFSKRKAMVNLQNIFVMEVFVVQTYPVTVGSCFHYPLQGSFSSRVPFLGNGNGVNCELGTGKFSQRKAMVNLQNIFVMEVFVVQTHPVTVGSCFHYPLQGIMDHSHQGFHSLERVMELIVNWERASFHKGRLWSTCKTYL
jgi:hypothetical protein